MIDPDTRVLSSRAPGPKENSTNSSRKYLILVRLSTRLFKSEYQSKMKIWLALPDRSIPNHDHHAADGGCLDFFFFLVVEFNFFLNAVFMDSKVIGISSE